MNRERLAFTPLCNSSQASSWAVLSGETLGAGIKPHDYVLESLKTRREQFAWLLDEDVDVESLRAVLSGYEGGLSGEWLDGIMLVEKQDERAVQS